MRTRGKIYALFCVYYAFVVPAGLTIFCATTSRCNFGDEKTDTTVENETVKLWSTKDLGCFFKNETFDRFTFKNLTEHFDEPRRF